MFNLPDKEQEILKLWQEKNIFQKTLGKESPKGNFIFYEGPPTANGRPGIHHLEARAFKDLIPRYKTMRGFKVERKAGWDTHGLPVELEVEKKLGLKNKKEVEQYGIKEFNQKCKESVWLYKDEWEKMTERIGFWLDMENPYITYDNNYIESLWWIIKQIYDRGFLYQGHKVVPQCPRCGTALSSHEVAQGYKNIKEESVYVKFKIKFNNHPAPTAVGAPLLEKEGINSDVYILAWTTTPWTLPGNVALAVGEDIDYALVKFTPSNLPLDKGGREGGATHEYYILAKDLVEKVFENSKYETIKELTGKDLVGLEYEPLFPGAIPESTKNFVNAFKVYPAEFVSTEDGTGVVHTAVMYGVDDYELGEKVGLPKVHTVNLDGTFNELVPRWQGRLVIDKKVKEEIVDYLRTEKLLFSVKDHAHDYPFCWRCDTPLVYYAKESWFFQMSALREQLIKSNETINWVPVHIKDGRFGEWLSEVKDWAISRERYWGTPLPIWLCQNKTENTESTKTQKTLSVCGNMIIVGSFDELEKISGQKINDPHRPFIDEITFQCDKCGGEMRRVPEVMDCWFDSGAMPFAQWHYPFENREKIESFDKPRDPSSSRQVGTPQDEIRYPANFICEAIDQTRGWFYTLLAVATLLGKEAPYKNVICLGHVLDKNGQKMSKHIGNVVDPWQMMEKYGADVVRWYLYTVNQPGEPKRFDESFLREAGRMFNTLFNVLTFYQIYVKEVKNEKFKTIEPKNVLDKWIAAKLNLLIKEVMENLDNYDIFSAARKIEEFINELSVWYLRRSRDRFKGSDEEDKNQAIFTLGKVLFELTKLLAPFTPFTAEYIYQELARPCACLKESVHLEDWPAADDKLIDQKVLDEMILTRQIVELGLAKRAALGIKVRQPLRELRIKNQGLRDEYLKLIKDELNVKEVVCESGEGELSVELDTNLTDELKEEGILRELVRAINNLRKEMKLTIKDRIQIQYNTDDAVLKNVFEKYTTEFKKAVLAEKISKTDEGLEKVRINEVEVGLKIIKI